MITYLFSKLYKTILHLYTFHLDQNPTLSHTFVRSLLIITFVAKMVEDQSKFRSDLRLVVTLDGPLVVKRDTALYEWLHDIGQWKEVTSLRNLICLLKGMIVRDLLFDPKNAKIVVCNKLLEKILGMKFLHTSQISSAILRSTFIIFDPRKLFHLLPVGTTIGNITHHISVQKDYTEKSANNESLPERTEKAILDDYAKNSQAIYLVNETLRRLIGLPSTPSTRDEVVRAFSKYVSSSKSILVDKRNLKVIIVKDDILGLIFNVNALYLGQALEYLHKHMYYVGEELLEDSLLSNIKEETDVIVIDKRVDDSDPLA